MRLSLDANLIEALFQKSLAHKRIIEPALSDSIYFYQWGLQVLNPILNHQLNRPQNHPTFERMMEYLMEPERKKKRQILDRMTYPDHMHYKPRR